MNSLLILGAGGVFLTCFGLRLFYDDKNRAVAVFAFSVILLSLFVSPLVQFCKNLPSSFEGLSLSLSGASFESGLSKSTEEAFMSGVQEAVSEKFDIKEENVTVYVWGFDLSAMRAEKIAVYLSGGGAFSDARGIRLFLLESGLCGECYVEIG